MWVDAGAEVRTRMRDRVQEAERERLAARARAGRGGSGPRRPLAAYGRRVRQAAGFGLVRTGLRLLDAGRA